MGPLAGLAAGGLLAALFMGGAFEGIKMMDVLMLAALMAAVFFVVRMLRKPRQEEHSARPMQYSGMGSGNAPAAATSRLRRTGNFGQFGGDLHSRPRLLRLLPAGTANIPADFQVEPFLRNAKTSFIRLQAANDARDLSDIREYTTPEMFAEISMQINERGNEPQKTEVLDINADCLKSLLKRILPLPVSGLTANCGNRPHHRRKHSMKSGTCRKISRIPKSVWLLAGIQQVS